MSLLQPPSFLQGALHSAINDRITIGAAMGVPLGPSFTNGVSAVGAGGGHGVVRDGDFAVTQQGTPIMGITVAFGYAFVRGTGVTRGSYGVGQNASTNKSIANSDPTNPRRDLVILHINDEEVDPGSGDNWDIQVVTGTPAASPSDPSLASFNNYMVLARVAVAAGATSIVNANITDLRTYAAGLMGIRRCTSTTRPTVRNVGERIREINTGDLYEWNGSAWLKQINGLYITAGIGVLPFGGANTASVNVNYGVTYDAPPIVTFSVEGSGGEARDFTTRIGTPSTTSCGLRASSSDGANLASNRNAHWMAVGIITA